MFYATKQQLKECNCEDCRRRRMKSQIMISRVGQSHSDTTRDIKSSIANDTAKQRGIFDKWYSGYVKWTEKNAFPLDGGESAREHCYRFYYVYMAEVKRKLAEIEVENER